MMTRRSQPHDLSEESRKGKRWDMTYANHTTGELIGECTYEKSILALSSYLSAPADRLRFRSPDVTGEAGFLTISTPCSRITFEVTSGTVFQRFIS
jgi:hypothetical protein